MNESNQLKPVLKFKEALSINLIDMVGIGPFITIPFVIGALNGTQSIFAWILGCFLSFMDASVWAELGAKWPAAGGSYVFLKSLYGKQKWGRFFSFLYIWQTSIQAPLVIASGAIGFAQYSCYLFEFDPLQQKIVAGALVVLVTFLLYRNMVTIGKMALFFGFIVIGTIVGLLLSGLYAYNPSLTIFPSAASLDFSLAFFVALGMASTKTIYSYLGYYNVCHLGSEIENPQRNIPRSMFLSIGIISVLYIGLNTAILAVIPWQTAKDSPFIVSLFVEQIYGPIPAKIATALVLVIALSSLFAVMLGYSRVPYAAAKEGNFFQVFAKVHPQKNIPHISLLILGALAFVFSLLFKMKEIITAIVVMRILVQFIAQSIGLIRFKIVFSDQQFPFKMWLYPLPPILAILVWLFVFLSVDLAYIIGALVIIVLGSLVFLFQAKKQHKWPFFIAT